MSSVFIIAEAGVNHNGDINIALEMVKAAARAGADAIKFQSFIAENIVSTHAPKATYQLSHTHEKESQLEMLKKYELSRADHDQLIDTCNTNHIEFMSTPFDVSSLELLLEYGLKTIKIASGEITNYPLLKRIGESGRRVILSTGMSTNEDIRNALTLLTTSGTDRSDIILLHCNTQYPTPYEDVNLYAVKGLKERFNVQTGYSDHTEGIQISLAATALGAVVIEKHFTLDKHMEGPDHKASADIDELNTMVKGIRDIEKSLGAADKKVSPSESENRDIIRKSIVAGRYIQKGETLTDDNLTTKRPGYGINPMRWPSVIGTVAQRDFQPDEMIEI